MKGNCLTVSVRRRKTVLMDGTELSQEMMWGGENLKRATGGTFTDWYRVLRMDTENSNKHSFSPKQGIKKPS
jgi:hypothetical protein